MNFLIEKALKSRVFANLFSIFLILLGILAIQNITVRLFPELNIEAINISVAYPGASPSEVEDAIVIPIEEQLEGLEGVRKITSVSSQNIGSVLVALESGSDLNKKLTDIQNEVDKITVFPQSSERPIVSISEPDELAMQILLHGTSSLNEIKQTANEVRNLLVDADNISDVRIEGAPEYLIDIVVEQQMLEAFNISIPEIAAIVNRQSLDLSGGDIEGTRTRQLVRTLGESKTGNEFSDIIVRTSEDGTQVRLDELGTINDALSDSPTAGYYNGESAVVLSIYRVGDEQIFDLVKSAKQSVESANRNLLTGTIEATIWRDESTNLQGRIDLLIRNAIIGILLVAALLMLTLDLRIATWVGFGVGVAFVGSFTLLSVSGFTINQLSLFGFILAIGIVVDDAIVVGENIFSRRERGLEPIQAASKGVSEVSTAVLASTATTIAVFVPLLLIPGIYGQFMGPIAAVVIFVLILSLLEAFFILPKHLSTIKNTKPRKYSPRRLADQAREWTAKKLKALTDGPVSKAINTAVKWPLLTVGGFVMAFVLSLGLIFSGAVKFVFFPEIEGNYITASFELTNRASQIQTERQIEYLENTAKKAAEAFTPSDDSNAESVILGIFSTRGKSVAGGDPNASNTVSSSSNLGYVTVKIEDSATRTFSAAAFERKWREASGQIPGAQVLTFSSNLVSAGAAVAIEVRSRNESQAAEVAKMLRTELEKIEGVTDIRDDRFNTLEEVQITLKPQALNFGVDLNTLASQIRGLFYGSLATRVQRDREEIDVRVRLEDGERSSLDILNTAKINVNGTFIPISAVANVEVKDTPMSISRKNGQNVISLTADVDTRQVTGGEATGLITNEAWKKIEADYPQVSVGVGGDQEEQQRAGPAIAKNFIVSLFVVYAVLAIVFSSYSQPLVIMSIIPFGFMGALLGHFLLGLDLTLLSMFGVIGLSGVIINDALLLIEFVNAKLKETDDIVQAVSEATKERFRPILLTSLTTFLGVTPIIFEPSVQAKFLAPTAVSLGIGILFATFILIFLLPAITILQLKIKDKLS